MFKEHDPKRYLSADSERAVFDEISEKNKADIDLPRRKTFRNALPQVIRLCR